MIRLGDFRMDLVPSHKHEGLTPENCGVSLAHRGVAEDLRSKAVARGETSPLPPVYFSSITLTAPKTHRTHYSPACLIPRIPNSFSFSPTPRSIRRFPFRLSIELIPMPPIISLISCRHADSRFTRRL